MTNCPASAAGKSWYILTIEVSTLFQASKLGSLNGAPVCLVSHWMFVPFPVVSPMIPQSTEVKSKLDKREVKFHFMPFVSDNGSPRS